MRVEVKGVEIASAETLKYLEYLIDRRLSFKAHAMYAIARRGSISWRSLGHLSAR